MRQLLLQNATAILLQNATEVYYKIRQFFITKCNSFITKYDSYYKMRRFYYKIRQVLQNATFITNCESAKCAIYQSFLLLIPLKHSITILEFFHWLTSDIYARALRRHSNYFLRPLLVKF